MSVIYRITGFGDPPEALAHDAVGHGCHAIDLDGNVHGMTPQMVATSSRRTAVVVGLLPGIGAWGVLMAKNGLRAAGLGGPAGSFSESLIGEFQKTDTWIAGAFAIEQGFLFTAMLLSAAVVGVIERRWRRAAAWSACAALLSACGLMHSYQWTFGDTALQLARHGRS